MKGNSPKTKNKLKSRYVTRKLEEQRNEDKEKTKPAEGKRSFKDKMLKPMTN